MVMIFLTILNNIYGIFEGLDRWTWIFSSVYIISKQTKKKK